MVKVLPTALAVWLEGAAAILKAYVAENAKAIATLVIGLIFAWAASRNIDLEAVEPYLEEIVIAVLLLLAGGSTVTVAWKQEHNRHHSKERLLRVFQDNDPQP